MSKELSAVEIAAALQAMGLEVPAELQAKVENSVSDRAEEYLFDRLQSDEPATAEEWRETMFSLAETMAADFIGQEKNVGQGRVFECFAEVETPSGAKIAIRYREPRDKK
jgi:hypothetical protein